VVEPVVGLTAIVPSPKDVRPVAATKFVEPPFHCKVWLKAVVQLEEEALTVLYAESQFVDEAFRGIEYPVPYAGAKVKVEPEPVIRKLRPGTEEVAKVKVGPLNPFMVVVAPPPPVCVTQLITPAPSVDKTCPAVPLFIGNVKVRFDA
jgi:hypothetical protein